MPSVSQHGSARRDGRAHHRDGFHRCSRCAACAHVIVNANRRVDGPAVDAVHQTLWHPCRCLSQNRARVTVHRTALMLVFTICLRLLDDYRSYQARICSSLQAFAHVTLDLLACRLHCQTRNRSCRRGLANDFRTLNLRPMISLKLRDEPQPDAPVKSRECRVAKVLGTAEKREPNTLRRRPPCHS